MDKIPVMTKAARLRTRAKRAPKTADSAGSWITPTETQASISAVTPQGPTPAISSPLPST
ncbi:MAG: hypothetical protein WC124_01540 [Desulfoplanes sp.]|nr:hypothetical protein [Desulfoplanes sp.]